MYKMRALIVCLAISLSGCATVKGPDVYLPGTNFYLKVRQDVKETTTKFVQIDGCMYHFDEEMPEASRSCPTVTRLHNTKNDGAIQIMAFPVKYENFLNNSELLWTLEQFFDQTFRERQPNGPEKTSNRIGKNMAEANLTWVVSGQGIMKERVVVFRVPAQVNQKEYTVFMVGHYPVKFHQEMLDVQNQMIADILGENKKE